MAITTLDAILTKMRKLIGSPSALQISDNTLKDYVNSFYLYDFPAKYRGLKLKDRYTFDTIRNVDTYTFNSERYTTVEAPAYCAKREIAYFQDPWAFWSLNFNWQYQEVLTTGNGSSGVYVGNTNSNPIVRSTNNNDAALSYPASRVQNILITTNTASSTLNVTDDGSGNLIGDCLTGTIDYETGAIGGLIFTSNVPQGANINIQYNPSILNIPLAIMFFQNQFTLRPIPDRGYTIEIIAYRQPTQVLANTAFNQGTPEPKTGAGSPA